MMKSFQSKMVTQIFVYLPCGPAATCTKRTESNNKNLCLQRKPMAESLLVDVPVRMSQSGL